ncbi:hypothetical protein CDL12_23187 [Handroanthus impetiginosus]|uniref:Uncharacterized protein n=1 Tax=Handroanthus impetiginosus TaxID=429701 RepID=A0A2G9GG61_9LAMI|nr:hypothetical protein CDL12_23187 [Handroanthus impetiginosus]
MTTASLPPLLFSTLLPVPPHQYVSLLTCVIMCSYVHACCCNLTYHLGSIIAKCKTILRKDYLKSLTTY